MRRRKPTSSDIFPLFSDRVSRPSVGLIPFLSINSSSANFSSNLRFFSLISFNSSWISRNMIISGGVVLSFLFLHFYDFWVPEINYKYIEFLPNDPDRYYEELIHKFESPVRTSFYSLSFIFLALHLLHGFSSSLKTVGVNSRYYNC